MYWNPNHSEDNDEGDDQEFSFGGREGLLALVDCSEYMFSEDKHHFREALELVEAIMKNKIITSDKDLIGIVLFNTKESPPPQDEIEFETGIVVPKHTAIFMPLASASADSIRKVINFRESDDLFDFERKYGHSNDSNLADVLWLCSRMFTRCGYKLEQSSIILFTSNDEPHPAGSYQYQQSFVKARDLQQLDVNLILIPMVAEFDGSKFYQEFLCTIADEDPEQFRFPLYQESRECLLNRIFRRDFRKKALSHLKFQLSQDVSLGVNIYSLSRKTKYPAKVNLLRDSNEVVVSKRSYQVVTADEDSENGSVSQPLLPGSQRKTQHIGGEKITFTVEEVTNMKQMLPPGIRLLGFKPLSKVSLVNHVRSSLFLYPDEGSINGSTTLFRALHEKCLAKQRAAFCMLTMRRKQPSKLIALVPQESCYDDDGEPFRHSGFRIEFIPYAADIRKLEALERPPPTVTQEQVDVFKSVVKKVKFKYHPSQFDNPVLMTLYTNIEALLFDRADLEVYDSTKPDVGRIDTKLEPFVDKISELLGEDDEAPRKRSKPSTGEGPSAKVPKIAPEVCSATIIETIKSGKTTGLLVATLRAYLQQQSVEGLSKMNKAALIEQVKQLNGL